MKPRLKLFTTGFLQVLLVAVNTYQIANKKYVGAVFVSFGISYLWTNNVKKIAFGNMMDRLAYASGAAIGTVVGIFAAKLIYEIILK